MHIRRFGTDAANSVLWLLERFVFIWYAASIESYNEMELVPSFLCFRLPGTVGLYTRSGSLVLAI
jgi:hypothetical protein